MTIGNEPSGRPFVFFHMGDPHATSAWPAPADASVSVAADRILLARQRRMEQDLQSILDDIDEAAPSEAVAFVYWPGDLAENGHADEYDVLAEAWAALRSPPPLRLIPGDHDRGLGIMTDFATFRAAMTPLPPVRSEIDGPPIGWPPRQRTRCIDQFYFHEDHGAVRCIFLDVVSAGHGRKGWGLDFRLGRGQFDWFVSRLREWRGEGRTCAVFMHCYPADFHEADEGTEIASLIWNEGVRLVEMGHTHYSELGHDGRTTYGAARSIGQNEDGPAGYAVVAIEDGEVSWRFRQVQQTWPFVMITSPVDRRLATRPLARDENGTIVVRALVLSDAAAGPVTCAARADGGDWHPLAPMPDTPGFVEGRLAWPAGSRLLQVKATGAGFPGWGKDLIDFDLVEPPTFEAAAFPASIRPERPGSDSCALPAWPDKGLRGDRLGPNTVGRKW